MLFSTGTQRPAPRFPRISQFLTRRLPLGPTVCPWAPPSALGRTSVGEPAHRCDAAPSRAEPVIMHACPLPHPDDHAHLPPSSPRRPCTLARFPHPRRPCTLAPFPAPSRAPLVQGHSKTPIRPAALAGRGHSSTQIHGIGAGRGPAEPCYACPNGPSPVRPPTCKQLRMTPCDGLPLLHRAALDARLLPLAILHACPICPVITLATPRLPRRWDH
jgi:hypothetical protein